eukprot:Selendium_serpulae@DN4654_c0_g1_i1.p1
MPTWVNFVVILSRVAKAILHHCTPSSGIQKTGTLRQFQQRVHHVYLFAKIILRVSDKSFTQSMSSPIAAHGPMFATSRGLVYGAQLLPIHVSPLLAIIHVC